MEKILSNAGYEVVVAEDGEQGQEGGHFVIGEIRHEAPATKIIAISGSSAVDGLAGALTSGADKIIAKPFRFENPIEHH